MNQLSDEDLLEKWSQGDNTAGEGLFDKYFKPIYRFFVYKVNEKYVEELVQKTFLACLEAKENFQGRSSFKTYLFGIAKNILFHFYRDLNRGLKIDDVGLTSVMDLNPSPSQIMARNQDLMVVVTLLRRLPLESQMILELFCWENLSHLEISQILAINENTSRSRLNRARTQFKEALSQWEKGERGASFTSVGVNTWVATILKKINR